LQFSFCTFHFAISSQKIMIRRLIQLCLDHPGRVLACFLAITGCWSVVLPGLKLQTDGKALFNQEHPDLKTQQDIDRIYGASEFTVVGLSAEGDDSIFTPEALNWILRFTREVQGLDGVKGDQVRSLATTPLVSSSDSGLKIAPPIGAEVLSKEQAEAIRTSVLSDASFRGTLISRYGKAAAIYIPMDAGSQRPRVFSEIERLATDELNSLHDRAPRFRTYVLGPAAAESLLGQHILTDLAVILPASTALIGLLLWVWFRQRAIVIVGIAEVAAMEIWSLGLMSAFHKPMSLVTVVMPVVLAVFCVADTIHIGQRFNEKCTLMVGQSRRAAMVAALDEVLKPVVFASLTAFAGFLSFAFSPIPPVRDLGLFTAFGIGCDLAVSLFVIPPFLLRSGFGSHRKARAAYPAVELSLGRLAAIVAAQPPVTIFLFVVVSTALGAGAARIVVQDSWVENFSPASRLVIADQWFNREFFGSDILNVLVDSGAEGGAFDPDFLLKIGRLEGELNRSSGGGGVVSLVDRLKILGHAMHLPDLVPSSREEADRWYLQYKTATAGMGPDPFVNPRGSEVNLWVFLNHGNYGKAAAVIDFVRRRLAVSGNGIAPKIRYAGNAYRGYLLVDSITRNLRLSLLASLAMTFVLVLAMLRSLKLACLAVLPVSLAVLWNFGAMGWIGVPLGVATSTFSAIALGMGVDFALHWMARFRLSQDQQPDWQHALSVTGARTGGAILLNAAVLIVGFGIMVLSRVPPNQRLGLLMCANLLACLAASLVLLPAFVAVLVKHESAQVLDVFRLGEST
jgi:predicted RND superfamily exporter protein